MQRKNKSKIALLKISVITTFRFICSNYNVGATDTIRRQNCVLDKSSNLNCPKTTKAPLVTTKRPTTTTKKSSRATTRKTVSSSGSDNVILKGFEVQVGRDGTRDKVTAKVKKLSLITYMNSVDSGVCL